MVRRVGAVAVLVLLVAGVISTGNALFGSDGTGAAAGPATTSSTMAATASTSPEATAVSTSTSTSEPAPAGPPTAADPAAMLIIGDSDAGAFGPYLEQLQKETGVVSTTLDYKVSSGLARPDFYDWPAEISRIVPEVDPDIVVVTFGGNDAQGLTTADGTVVAGQPTGDGDEKWRAEYGARVGAVMDALTADGRTLIWVGIPNHQNPDVTKRLQVQDEVVRAEVAKRPGVRFVDTWAMFAGKQGGYAEYHVDPRDGQGKDVRASDGFHLNTVGAEILAIAISDVVKDDLRARGAAL